MTAPAHGETGPGHYIRANDLDIYYEEQGQGRNQEKGEQRQHGHLGQAFAECGCVRWGRRGRCVRHGRRCLEWF